MRLVTYYRPGDYDRRSQRRTATGEVSTPRLSVYEQHVRYHMKSNERRDPRTLADERLLAKLREWRADGKEVLLMGDFNQDAYDSPLAGHLTSEDIGLEEQFQKLHGSRAPFSHMMGKKPIMVVYATSGVTVISYFLSKHHVMGSVGDHRLHVLDVCSKTIMGRDTPQTTRSTRRRLRF